MSFLHYRRDSKCQKALLVLSPNGECFIGYIAFLGNWDNESCSRKHLKQISSLNQLLVSQC